MRHSLVVVASAVVLLVGCGKAQVGEVCSESSDCAEGTQCILNGSMSIGADGPACVDTDKLCSITCNGDADCAVLGSGYICIEDCYLGSCLQGSRG